MDIKLSNRMKAVAGLAVGDVVADIGCDHGYVSMYLVSNGFKKAIAMDLREGPLQMARTNIATNSLSDKIDIRLSDGFEKLEPNEADCAVIAGMGGILVTDILKRGHIHTENGIKLVLQPQSDIDQVREYLSQIGYKIVDEVMLIDEGKYYLAMRAEKSSEKISYSEIELKYGPILIASKNQVLKEYLIHEREKTSELIENMKRASTEKALERVKELEDELACIENALQEVI